MASHNDNDTVFTSKLGVLVATLGTAVGLGNIWKFPALTGQNGGAAFVIIYIVACFALGLPLMVAEITLGRMTGKDIVSTFKELAPHRAWFIIAIFSLFSGILVIAYYSDVVGWVFTYLGKSFFGELNTTEPTIAKDIFDSVVHSAQPALTGQFITFAVIGIVLTLGVHTGIERISKILLPILTILLIGIAINNLFLEKAMAGLEFLFKPDFSKVTTRVVLEAVGLAFFKLSLGMGTLYTYGSYFPKNQNIPLVATRVMFADLAISLIAGIAIFPAVFTFNFEPTSGTSLLFITIPAVFAQIPGGTIITVLFFILTLFAALGASISLVEVSVATLIGQGCSRIQAVLIAVIGLFFIGIFATLSLTPVLSDVRIFGENIFDIYDFCSSNILMPLGGFFTALFIGYAMEKNTVTKELTNQYTLFQHSIIIQGWYFLIRYIVPILILVVLFNGLDLWNTIENIFT